jgi:hypothetical protein
MAEPLCHGLVSCCCFIGAPHPLQGACLVAQGPDNELLGPGRLNPAEPPFDLIER